MADGKILAEENYENFRKVRTKYIYYGPMGKGEISLVGDGTKKTLEGDSIPELAKKIAERYGRVPHTIIQNEEPIEPTLYFSPKKSPKVEIQRSLRDSELEELAIALSGI